MSRPLHVLWLWLAVSWGGGFEASAESDSLASSVAEPVFQVDVRFPTRDKPQSKLWYAEGHWWAWLPTQNGSSVWKRDEDGWHRSGDLDPSLRGLPGQADVWADDDGVRAVLLGEQRLAVVGLRFDRDEDRYQMTEEPTVWDLEPPAHPDERVETVTIARDAIDRWWVAYDLNRRMWVRWSLDPETRSWSDPMEIGGPARPDDISLVVRLPGAVGVVWSDQEADAVWFRRHLDDKPPHDWEPAETVAQGGKTADDHLNAAVAPDGTLYVATKNEVDQVGRPQLVLRIRHPDGRWDNHDYAERTREVEPSRPIAVLGGDPLRLWLAHTLYVRDRAKPRSNFIAGMLCDPARLDLNGPTVELISASENLNDVTACKAMFPSDANVPWIVLASDSQGNLYEAILPRTP